MFGSGSLRARIRIAQVHRGIVRESGWTGAGDRGNAAVEAEGESAVAPVIRDRRRAGDAVSAADHHLVRCTPGEAEPRKELAPVRVVDTVGKDQSAPGRSASGFCTERLTSDMRFGHFVERRNDFPAQSRDSASAAA